MAISPGSWPKRKLSGTTSVSNLAMRKIIVTGSAGLIGSESVRHFAAEGYRVIGIDNDMRSHFFGAEASTQKTRDDLVRTIANYEHHDLDIREAEKVSALFKEQGN